MTFRVRYCALLFNDKCVSHKRVSNSSWWYCGSIWQHRVERFVVLFLFQVRQLVHHDHPQKGFRRIAKDGRDADLRFGLQLAALYAGDGGMQAERVFSTWILLSYITLLIGGALLRYWFFRSCVYCQRALSVAKSCVPG